MEITSEQCRAARALLGWSQGQLADITGLTVLTISAFEKGGKMRANNNGLLVMAFEDGGVQFIPKNGGGAGVRLKR